MTAKELARSTAFEMLKDKSTDCNLYAGLKMPGAVNHDMAKAAAMELESLGIIEAGWEVFGSYYLRAKYNRKVLEAAIQGGLLG